MIGTLATRAEEAGIPTCVISHDRDAFQLVSDARLRAALAARRDGRARVHAGARRGALRHPARARARLPRPQGRPLATTSRACPASATRRRPTCCVRFGSLEGIYANLPGRAGREAARDARRAPRRRVHVARRSATIERDLPTRRRRRPALIVDPPDRAGLKEIFRRFEFRALLRRIDELDEAVPARRAGVAGRSRCSVVEVDEPGLAAFLAGAQEAGVARASDGRYAVAAGGAVALADDRARASSARLLDAARARRAHDFKAAAARARGLRASSRPSTRRSPPT